MPRFFSVKGTVLLLLLILTPVLPESVCAETVTVTEGDCGKSIAAAAGDKLVIVLGGNPTTGYTWEIKSAADGSVLKFADSRYETARPLPGSPGTFFFTFQAGKPGHAALELIYHRPWEKAEPLRKCAFEVVVGGKK